MASDDLKIEVIVDPIFGKTEIVKKSKKAGKAAGDGFSSSFKKSTKNIGIAIAASLAAVGAAFTALAVSSTRAAGELETIGTQLKVLTGSAGAAAVVLGQLTEFAEKTPFEFKEITQAANRLIAFGFSAGEVVDKLGQLGDVAAGSNTDLRALAFIFGQISSEGKLTGERLRQLGERSIPIIGALAQTLGETTSRVRELVTAGKISFADFERAFISLSAEGGKFEGALVAQSKTLNGAISNLGDSFFILKTKIGKAFSPSIVSLAKSLASAFEKLGAAAKNNQAAISTVVEKLASLFLIKPINFLAEAFTKDDAERLKEINIELSTLTKRLDLVRGRFERQKSGDETLLDKLFGSVDEAGSLGKGISKLGDKINTLNNEKKALLSTEVKSSNIIEKELKDQARLAAIKREAAAEEVLRKKASEALGQTGLTNIQKLEENLVIEQELLRQGLENKALTEEEFRDRSLESQRVFDEQSAGLAETQAAKLEKIATASLKRMSRVSVDIGKTVSAALANTVANSVNILTRALVLGEKGFGSFAQNAAAVMGDLATQLGKMFIAAGIAIEATKTLGGFGAIAAGSALVAVGAILSSFSGGASGIGTSLGGESSNFPGAGGGVGAPGEDLSLVDQEDDTPGRATAVTVNIQGDVLDSEETGLRIVTILNEAFDKEGVVINQGVTA